MSEISSRRVNAMVRDALAAILEQEIADPRLELVTIRDVDVTRDHGRAHVTWSLVDPGLVSGRRGSATDLPGVADAEAGFAAATKRIRSLLGQRVRLRKTPELVFRLDPTIGASSRVDELLRGLHVEDDQ
ncbi:MAG TPA: ribosome-binding factor A [Nitriliruptorales bacterium]